MLECPMLGCQMYLSNDQMTKCDICSFGHVTNTSDIPTWDIPTFDNVTATLTQPSPRGRGIY